MASRISAKYHALPRGLQGGFIKVDIKGVHYNYQWNPQLDKQITLLLSVCFSFSFPVYSNKETTSSQSRRDKQVYKSRKQVAENLTAGTPLFYPHSTIILPSTHLQAPRIPRAFQGKGSQPIRDAW